VILLLRNQISLKRHILFRSSLNPILGEVVTLVTTFFNFVRKIYTSYIGFMENSFDKMRRVISVEWKTYIGYVDSMSNTKCKYCENEALTGEGVGEAGTCRLCYLKTHPKTRRIQDIPPTWAADFELEAVGLEDLYDLFKEY
jgi:hypothetical protein